MSQEGWNVQSVAQFPLPKAREYGNMNMNIDWILKMFKC